MFLTIYLFSDFNYYLVKTRGCKMPLQFFRNAILFFNKLPKRPSRKLKTLTCCVCQCNQNAKSAIRRDFKMSLNATGYVILPGERLKYRTLPCDIIAACSLTPAFSFRMKLTTCDRCTFRVR